MIDKVSCNKSEYYNIILCNKKFFEYVEEAPKCKC